MLASHNTLTYLPPRRRWARLFARWWRCQRLTAAAQYAAGARRLDIRIRRTSRGAWRPCHGIIDLGREEHWSLALLLKAHGILPTHAASLRIVLERTADPEADTRVFRDAVAITRLRGYDIPEAAIKRPWQWVSGPDTATPSQDHYLKLIDTARPWWRQMGSILRGLLSTPRSYAKANPIPPDHRSDTTLHYHDFI